MLINEGLHVFPFMQCQSESEAVWHILYVHQPQLTDKFYSDHVRCHNGGGEIVTVDTDQKHLVRVSVEVTQHFIFTNITYEILWTG